MNIFSFTGLLMSVSCVALGVFSIIRAEKKAHYLCGIFFLAVSLWGLGVYYIGISKDVSESVFWWKVAYIGVILIPFLFTHFVIEFLGLKKAIILPLYGLAIFFLYVNLLTNLFIDKLRFVFGQFYYLTPSFLYNAFVVVFILLIIYSHA